MVPLQKLWVGGTRVKLCASCTSQVNSMYAAGDYAGIRQLSDTWQAILTGNKPRTEPRKKPKRVAPWVRDRMNQSQRQDFSSRG